MNETLIKTIRSIIPLPEEEALKLDAICHRVHLEKGDLWIREGQIPKYFGFVEQGVFRIFYSDVQGNYVTKSFFQEGAFLSAYTAMHLNSPSFFNIEALEDAELILVDFQKWLKLYEDYHLWKDFLIGVLTKGYMKKEKREREFLQLSAEERYRIFLQEYPGLENRVKQHLIASYLGITPVALSRIRRKMGLVNPG
ncbi:Crp/Fnr family transcriptional regulator [Echinicola jeungdonensis]|uniref:Crp/Fnr family transcriptional regulator n=1 Tax=Echinicola jeungdonensis TaxID=709343 RepID=A0ABV5J7L5_9BACT|nr:Crp/Fnr family transcriptional regulator [Echinicola jeungdonensis]MDN3669716.1 Crp/Fnr family transcriptional regulator [Echinicola jeungdonensis]